METRLLLKYPFLLFSWYHITTKLIVFFSNFCLFSGAKNWALRMILVKNCCVLILILFTIEFSFYADADPIGNFPITFVHIRTTSH